MKTQLTVNEIAELCHELNRTYCAFNGDESQRWWSDAPDWQRVSAVNGVRFAIENPDATPESMHENWTKDKVADGWVYGEVKDAAAKTHPCLVPYDQLPENQRFKDSLFLLTVRFFAGDGAE
jgi:hypothetical protein